MHYEEMGSLGSFEYEYDPHKEQMFMGAYSLLDSQLFDNPITIEYSETLSVVVTKIWICLRPRYY